MVSKLESLYSWLMFPVYAWQGTKVRRATQRLQPPPHKETLKKSGKGTPLSILLLGDSSAAGVGVDTIEESLGGHLIRRLSEITGRPIQLRIAGFNSATSPQIRDYVVPNLASEPYDFIALNIGTNDAKNFHRGNLFCKNFGTLLYALKAKWPAATIIWSGIINLEELEILPSPLNKILGIRSRILNRNGEILCAERNALAPGNREWKVIRENFSKDGFHASALGYERWAEGLADYIIGLENENSKVRK